MLGAIKHLWRLGRAGRILARYDALANPQQIAQMPAPVRIAHRLARVRMPFERAPAVAKGARGERLSSALAALGPSYIKLGQFLATRPDMIGADAAADLLELQDRLPPFERSVALAEISTAVGCDAMESFTEIGDAVAAASIAQVHRARTREASGDGRDVAVKVLRPGIEKRFGEDLESFLFAARLGERVMAPLRRLRPVAAVETLARSVELEMDLRMEAAAISEMAGNVTEDDGFRVPAIDWQRTARRVLTVEWIDGTPLSDLDAVRKAGHDLDRLGNALIQHFLRHAMRDGFFHADMHQGNLFVDASGGIVAVDFGIMGRLSPKDRRFLAEILYGFITRDYKRVSDVHFDAGYVPAHQDAHVFAQALRAIGEPLMDRDAEDISMATLLSQLFLVTEQFDMETQPQLILLQKTMVVVEGVARMLNPKLNMWTAAEPVVEDWMQSRLGPEGRLQDASEGAVTLGRFMADLPELLGSAGQAAHHLSQLTSGGGLRLDNHTTRRLAAVQSRHSRSTRAALWIGAIALAALAVAEFW